MIGGGGSSRSQTRAESTRVYPVVLAVIVAGTAVASAWTRNERALFIDPGTDRPAAQAFVAVTPAVARRLPQLPRFGYAPAPIFSPAPSVETPLPTAPTPATPALYRPLETTSDVLGLGTATSPIELADVFTGLDTGFLPASPNPPAEQAAAAAAAPAAATVAEVPEPASWVMMLAGLLIVSVCLRRRPGRSVEPHPVTLERHRSQAA